jgi:hypothetical protein
METIVSTMNKFRFISSAPNTNQLHAIIIESRNHEQALGSMRAKLTQDEKVVSVNVHQDGNWLVIEGEPLEASQIISHPDYENPGALIEGPATASEDVKSTAAVTQPEKRGRGFKVSGSPTPSLPKPGAIGVSGEPLIVVIMGSVSGLLLIAALIGAVAINWSYVPSAPLMMLTLFSPPLAALVITFILKYLAGIHATLLRMEAANKAE